jgi:FKBP-type peptidyl-prolyl cis-trans isomerase
MRSLMRCALALSFVALAGAAPVPTHLMPKDAGWRKLSSGVEVWDVKEGTGDPVKPGATVVVHYTGWLTDEKGTKFDSSRDRDQKLTFALANVIKGWQEGVPGMKPGGVRKLKVPPELGYGARGAGNLIPPNATLVFEIELFEAK